MPRTADHDARRRQVLDALCRITVRGGLEAATFREVAAEAGTSVRVVQYYFGTKAELLASANRYALQRSAQRLFAALEALGPDPTPRDAITAVMRSFLPADTEAREAMILFYAFYTAQLTNPSLAVPESDGGRGLQTLFANQITRAQAMGSVTPDVDPDSEATLLYLLLPSLASAAVAGRTELARAEQIIDYAIARLFDPPNNDAMFPARRARSAPRRR